MAKLKLALIPPLKSIIKLGSNRNAVRPQPGEEVTQQVPPVEGCSRTKPQCHGTAMGTAVWLQPGWALRCCSNPFSPIKTHLGNLGLLQVSPQALLYPSVGKA